MIKIGLIKEGKIPADNRVALTPAQCKWVNQNIESVKIVVESSLTRCFTDREFLIAGIEVKDDISDCDFFLGIKEVPVEIIVPKKTYLFFSHTKKEQPRNQKLLRAILDNQVTLIDYECLEHEDGQRIIGFGFFAGVVGAHNGMMAYGNRTGTFTLDRVYKQRSFRDLIHTYFGLRLPNVKIVVTGSGRVAHGVVEIMNLMGIVEVDPDEYLQKKFTYPVYCQVKGNELYEHAVTKQYSREDFHLHPGNYKSKFLPYSYVSDILMNGVYWEKNIPRLFEKTDVQNQNFVIQTIADIADDAGGSVPVNFGDLSIDEPIYGVDRKSLQMTAPYIPGSIDIMAVGNLPNELPRDASRYFGEQLIRYVLPDLVSGSSPLLEKATIVKNGKLTEYFQYLRNYADGKNSTNT
ncbi:MAG TPA: NAD(P)-dependent oxidoreductase [Chitinophagaceae bacterium]|nr:NAD(P)-dependent oxidoreductase [Chitinophagaceae bacterium]